MENAKYSTMLFATDSNGMLYAIDPIFGKDPAAMNNKGYLRGFLNGANSVQLTSSDAQTAVLTALAGVALSSVDYNLWHETAQLQSNVAGHGIGSTPDDSRGSDNGDDTSGGASMYFGLEGDQNYNVPGGADGSSISSVFSLAAYTSQDCPTLYFT